MRITLNVGIVTMLMMSGSLVRAQTPVEYSNVLDVEAVAAGGAHAGLDPQQVLYTEPPDATGAPFPMDILDLSTNLGVVCAGDPEEEIDALASCFDAYFHQVRRNRANLLISFGGDPGGNAVWFEAPGGATGVAWSQADLSNPNPSGDVEDVDGLDIWGPLRANGVNHYSETGDPRNFSVLTTFAIKLAVPHSAIVAAVRFLGYTGPDSAIDLDGLMVRRSYRRYYSTWGPGARIIFSIRSTIAAGGSFDGGEIMVLPFGGFPSFLSHGGHLWDTAFNVSATFGVPTEEVDAIEAAPPAQFMVVLVDRSGSMITTRPSTGNSRCADAVTTATADVRSFFAANPTGSVAVWTFGGDGGGGVQISNITSGFVGRAAALSALGGLSAEGCEGGTPIADAICGAADALAAIAPTSPGDRVIAVSSDGEENSSTGECSGSNSTLSPPPAGNYSPGSWQRRVYDKVTGEAVVLTRFWGALAAARSGGFDGGKDPETGIQRGASVSDEVFFMDLADSTGGTYLFMDDSINVVPEAIGACCTEGEACIEVSQFMCESIHGQYQGDGSTCDLGQEQCYIEDAEPVECDFDEDGDRDLFDFAEFVLLLSGPLP